MPKHSMCPLTAGAPIRAHMLSEKLSKTSANQLSYVLFTWLLLIAAAGAFFQMRIAANHDNLYVPYIPQTELALWGSYGIKGG